MLIEFIKNLVILKNKIYNDFREVKIIICEEIHMSLSLPPINGPFGEYPIEPGNESAGKIRENLTLPDFSGEPTTLGELLENCQHLRGMNSPLPESLDQLSKGVLREFFATVPQVLILGDSNLGDSNTEKILGLVSALVNDAKWRSEYEK